MFLLMLGAALTKFLAGRYIKQRKLRTFCMVVAALGCLNFLTASCWDFSRFIVLGCQSVAKAVHREVVGASGGSPLPNLVRPTTSVGRHLGGIVPVSDFRNSRRSARSLPVRKSKE